MQWTTTTLTALLPLLASLAVADARHIPLRRHGRPAAAPAIALDERGLPITATTTVVVDMTSTQTIWVPPTGQVPMQPEPSLSASASSVNSTSTSWDDQPSASASASASASESEASVSSSYSESEWISSSVPLPSETADWASSAISSPAVSASQSASDSPSSVPASSGSETAAPSASASVSSDYVSDMPSSSEAWVSSSWSASASEATESTNATASISASASANATASASASSWSEYASDASSSVSTSDSLTEASTPSSSISAVSTSSSIPSASASFNESSASMTASASLSASVSASFNESSASMTASPSASASANATTSVNDWDASSSAAWNASASASATSMSASLEASASASASASSSAFNETSASASASAISSSSSLLPSSTAASSSSASPSPSSGTNLPGVPRTLMAGYFPDWSAWTLPPESVDWTKFDVVDFAFAIPTWDGRLEFTQWESSDLLNRLVAGAHRNGKRVKLSIGGWTGSKYFSPLLADWNSRQNFVNNCVQAYHAYNLDGLDVDWEYPNAGGAQGNIISSADSANYLLFLRELRAALPEGALLTLATQVWPFAGPSGRPLSDVSGFAEVVDWILIMNYDIWGSSDNPGPNAPLSDACGTSTQPLANAYAAIASWTSAGMPADKITLGVPAYGYLQKSWATSLRTRDYIPPSADEIANLTAAATASAALAKRQGGIVTVRNSGGGDDNGQIGFNDLVRQGALALDSQGKYIGAGGFYREWDHCSSTPWIRSSYSGQVVTYDDPDSLSMKAQFARQSGLRGINMWSMDSDWNGSAFPLTNALRSGLGL